MEVGRGLQQVKNLSRKMRVQIKILRKFQPRSFPIQGNYTTNIIVHPLHQNIGQPRIPNYKTIPFYSKIILTQTIK